MAGFYLAFTNMPLAAVKIKFSIFSELLIMLLHMFSTGLYRVNGDNKIPPDILQGGEINSSLVPTDS